MCIRGLFFGDFLLAPTEESYPPAGADTRRVQTQTRQRKPRKARTTKPPQRAAPSFQPPPSTLYSCTWFCASSACTCTTACCAATASAARRAGRAHSPRRCGSAGRPAAARVLGLRLRPLRAQLLAQRRAAGQRVGHFAEGGLDRLLVLRHRDVARRLGRSQVGAVAAGVEDRQQQLRRQAPGEAAALNRPPSSLLAVPTLAVSEMRGKKAARAAPMLALAAISCCSAWRTSGRRISTSDGSPAGSVGAAAALPSGCAGGKSAGSGWPSSRASAFSSSARWRCSCGQRRRAPLRPATRPGAGRARTMRRCRSAAG